jgi:hypothetical protein
MSVLLPDAIDPAYAAEEAMIASARESLSAGTRIRSERVQYYRTPRIRPDGRPHVQAGWVCWGDTQQQAQLQKIARGYIPIKGYPWIEAKHRDTDSDGPFETWGPWGVLIAAPGGMSEFPADQILTYHWYDADRLRFSLNGSLPPTVKVKGGMVLWPQLAGANIKIFACPECHDWRALEALFLARHLRIWHDFAQADILAFGQQHNVDFSSELNRDNKVLRSVLFDEMPEDEAPAETEAEGFTFEVARPQRGRPRKES